MLPLIALVSASVCISFYTFYFLSFFHHTSLTSEQPGVSLLHTIVTFLKTVLRPKEVTTGSLPDKHLVFTTTVTSSFLCNHPKLRDKIPLVCEMLCPSGKIAQRTTICLHFQ